jgi:hypothetical protein
VDDIWIGYATVGPVDDDSAGGIVPVLGVSDTDTQFRDRVEEALALADLHLDELNDVETLRTYSERHGLSAAMTELLVEALRSDEIAIGTVYSYAQEEDDDGSVRESLAEALAEAPLVRIERFGDRVTLTGFVVGVGGAWLLLHLVGDGVALDGWTAVPLTDVADVTLVGDEESFAERALRLRGETPEALPDIALGETRSLIASAQALFPLVTLHLERNDDICYIGRVEDVDEAGVVLRLLSPAASWEESERFPYGEISRIEFGTAYDTALADVADEASSETG